MNTELTPGTIRNSVLIGNDGYLFLHSGAQHQFDYLLKNRSPTYESIINFKNNLYHRHLYCKERGIKYLHVLFPSKPLIARNKLPTPYQNQIVSLFESEYKHKIDKEGDHILYLKEFLEELNYHQEVFNPLDTHLNDFGSLQASKLILNNLNLNYETNNEFITTTHLSSGDLATMLDLNKKIYTSRIKAYAEPISFDNIDILKRNTNNLKIIFNPYTNSPLRLLVFGDSFIKFCLPYLAPCFKEIIYFRSQFQHNDLIDLISPDIVISSNTERYLSLVESDRNGQSNLKHLFLKYNELDSTFQNAIEAQLSFKHYPHIHSAWINSLGSKNFTFPPLGPCTTNDQIDLIDFDAKIFEATGNDPNITFHNITSPPNKEYTLQISMTSSVNSVSAIYFTNRKEFNFKESQVLRQPVIKGSNNLIFKINQTIHGNRLRFDPIARPGLIEIQDINLTT